MFLFLKTLNDIFAIQDVGVKDVSGDAFDKSPVYRAQYMYNLMASSSSSECMLFPALVVNIVKGEVGFKVQEDIHFRNMLGRVILPMGNDLDEYLGEYFMNQFATNIKGRIVCCEEKCVKEAAQDKNKCVYVDVNIAPLMTVRLEYFAVEERFVVTCSRRYLMYTQG